MALTQRTEASTKDAFARACAVVVQNQAEVVLAWQKVVSTVHTAAVLFREDNVKLLASNAALEAEKRNIIGQNIDLKDRVSVLIADRDRLAAKLQEQGEGSTAEIPGNGNSNSNDNCIDCTTLAGQLDVSSATPSIATTIIKRASAVAAAAPDAAFANSAPSPTIASDTATGQSGSTFTTVAEMDAGTTTTTMKMAPQQCEAGLLTETASPSASLSAVAAVVATVVPTAELAPCTTTNDQPHPDKVYIPVASTTTAAAAATPSSTSAVITTTMNSRVAAVASAAPVAAFANPAAAPTIASDTATGHRGSRTTTIASRDAVTTPTTTTMAPQQCEARLLAKTAVASASLSAVATLGATASTANSAPRTTENDKAQPVKLSTPDASAPIIIATPTPTAAATPAITTSATKLQPENVTKKPTRHASKVGGFVTEGRAAWVGGGARNAVFPSPSAVGNKAQAMSPSATSPVERQDIAAARRVSSVGGGVGGAVLPSPSALGNRAQAMSPPVASSAERRGTAARRVSSVGGAVGGAVFSSPSALGNRVQALAASSTVRRGVAARRASAATRSPLSAVTTNTMRPAVPSAATGKVRKAVAPVVDKPGRASLTRSTQSSRAPAVLPAVLPVKRIVSDDRGADGNRSKPEGMYGRQRSSGRPRKTDAKVVAGGGQKVVSGAGVSSLAREEAVTNKGAAAAGRRSKVVPKKRWV